MPAARNKKDDRQSPSSEEGPNSLDVLKDSNGDKPKRKRQSQSCDACRARKVRCARDNPDDAQQSCKHCIALGIKCTYDYQPKKRGPPNLYLRRLQEAAAAALIQQQQQHQVQQVSVDGNSPTSFSPSESALSPGSATSQSPMMVPSLPATTVSPVMHTNNGNGLASTGYVDHSPLNNLLPSSYPIAADNNYNFAFEVPKASRSQRSGSSIPSSTAVNPGRPSSSGGMSDHNGSIHGRQSTSPRHQTQPLLSPSLSEAYPSYPNFNWSMPSPSLTNGGQTNHLARTYPPLSHFGQQRHSLNSLPVPRSQILHIISLFFDFVYPLTPCIHKPSFMADLHNHREESDSLFFALVLSTVASTLVQVPRSYLPFFDRGVVRKLALYCSEASRLITVAGYDSPCSMHVVVRYFDTIYHFCEGHDATSHASFGEAAHIAVTLHMHEEASYEGLDPIEGEMRRRAFWLLFGADKSMSILLGRPICLRDEDCTLHFPKEVDDEYITSNGILPQPVGKTAIVSGLNYITRIFALLGEILVRIRVDKRSPPQGPLATARLEEIRSLHTRIVNALGHAPPPLRLKSASSHLGGTNKANGVGGSSNGMEYGGLGSRTATFAEVKSFFDDPNASRANASNAFLVMQANLYVTQQLVRFVIEQYRDELITKMRAQMGDSALEGLDLARGWTSEDREAVASDLLNVLHSIPIQSIATNGPSLVHKVRFVASTLLDAVRKAETAPASAARAHAYLWDFLSILSEIERNYLLDDDRDGCSSSADSVSIMGN